MFSYVFSGSDIQSLSAAHFFFLCVPYHFFSLLSSFVSTAEVQIGLDLNLSIAW